MCAQRIPAPRVFGVEIEYQTITALGIARMQEGAYHIYTFPDLAPGMFDRLPASLNRSGKKPSLLELVIDKHDPAVFAIETYDSAFVETAKVFLSELMWSARPAALKVTRAGLRLLAYHSEPLQLRWGSQVVVSPDYRDSGVIGPEFWLQERTLMVVSQLEAEGALIAFNTDRELVSLVEKHPAILPGDLPVYAVERVPKQVWSIE